MASHRPGNGQRHGKQLNTRPWQQVGKRLRGCVATAWNLLDHGLVFDRPRHGHGLAMAWQWHGGSLALARQRLVNCKRAAMAWLCRGHGFTIAWQWHGTGLAWARPRLGNCVAAAGQWFGNGLATAWTRLPNGISKARPWPGKVAIGLGLQRRLWQRLRLGLTMAKSINQRPGKSLGDKLATPG